MEDTQATPKEKLRQIESRLVEILTSIGYLKGRSKRTAEITAYITIRGEVTQKLLRELTGYSLGTVSSTLQSLENSGVIRKHKNPNSRGYIYRSESTFTDPQSRPMMTLFEYFSQMREFLAKIEKKLDQPHLREKTGYENIKNFVANMNLLFPAVEQVLHKISGSSETQRGRDSR